MGLPTAALFAQSGANVVGFDISNRRVQTVNAGKTGNEEPGLQEIIQTTLAEGRFHATSDAREISSCGVAAVIVPLIIDDKKNMDYANIKSAVKTVAENMSEGTTVIIRTTMPIGGTREILKPILDGSGKKYFLAYAPIRATSGTALRDMKKQYPTIVGGFGEEASKRAAEAIASFFENEIIPLSPEEAEAVKLFEVIYRNVNISIANEFAQICESQNLDYWRIREAVNRGIAHHHLMSPGTGVGGHCLPVYPYLILNRMDTPGLIRFAQELNEQIPKRIAEMAVREAKAFGESATICILGLGYRENSPELRFSPSVDLAKELSKSKPISICEPLLPNEVVSKYGNPATLEELENFDVLVLSVNHECFKGIEKRLRKSGPQTIIDCRNFIESTPGNVKLVKIGVGKLA